MKLRDLADTDRVNLRTRDGFATATHEASELCGNGYGHLEIPAETVRYLASVPENRTATITLVIGDGTFAEIEETVSNIKL